MEVPDWLKEDDYVRQHLSASHQEMFEKTGYALVVTYDASSNTGTEQPGQLNREKAEQAMLANLALWVIQPSEVRFTNLFYADDDHEQQSQPTIVWSEATPMLYCHPKDQHHKVTENQLTEAAILHTALCGVARQTVVWEALRAFWAALTMGSADRRYPFYWLGFEALFGPDHSTGEIIYKLAQRIAFFTGNSPDDARKIFKTVKACYGIRSTILHGRWDHNKDIDTVMGQTEDLVRKATRYIVGDQKTLSKFISKERDTFLEDMIFDGLKPRR